MIPWTLPHQSCITKVIFNTRSNSIAHTAKESLSMARPYRQLASVNRPRRTWSFA